MYRTVNYSLTANINGCDPVQMASKTQSYSILWGTSLTGPFLISINVNQERQRIFFLMCLSLVRFSLFVITFSIELIKPFLSMYTLNNLFNFKYYFVFPQY